MTDAELAADRAVIEAAEHDHWDTALVPSDAAFYSRARARWPAALDEIVQLRTDNASLKDLLKEREWIYDAQSGKTECWTCGAFGYQMQPLTHQPDCRLAKYLAGG